MNRIAGRISPAFIWGLVTGLLIALGVALLVTQSQSPFSDEVAQSADGDSLNDKASKASKAKADGTPDPNMDIYSKVQSGIEQLGPDGSFQGLPPINGANDPAGDGSKVADAVANAASTVQTAVQNSAEHAAKALMGIDEPSSKTSSESASQKSASQVALAAQAMQQGSVAGAAGAIAGVKPSAIVAVPSSAKPKNNDPVSQAQYFLQVGSFRNREDAEQLRAKLALLGSESEVVMGEVGGTVVNRVRVGPFNSANEAYSARAPLTKGGFEAALIKE